MPNIYEIVKVSQILKFIDQRINNEKFLIALFTAFCLATSFVYANPIIDKAYHEKEVMFKFKGSGKVKKILK